MLEKVDGSESALRAVRYAMKLARENGPCSIHLVNVHEPPLLYGELAVYVPREKMERLQREHSEALLEPAAAILREGSVPFTTETLVGEVAATIARRADELGCAPSSWERAAWARSATSSWARWRPRSCTSPGCR